MTDALLELVTKAQPGCSVRCAKMTGGANAVDAFVEKVK